MSPRRIEPRHPDVYLTVMCKAIRFIVCISMLCMLVGCVLPYPHSNWLTPEINGHVYIGDNHPVSDARIYYEKYPDIETKTNSSGFYRLKPKRKFEFFAILCPGPCDTISEELVLVSESKQHGKEKVSISTCVGHPSWQCNRVSIKANFHYAGPHT